MSIASEITRLQLAKADIKTAIENKGVTVADNAKLDSYAGLVDNISSKPKYMAYIIKSTTNDTTFSMGTTADGVALVTTMNSSFTALSFYIISNTKNEIMDPSKITIRFKSGSEEVVLSDGLWSLVSSPEYPTSKTTKILPAIYYHNSNNNITIYGAPGYDREVLIYYDLVLVALICLWNDSDD